MTLELTSDWWQVGGEMADAEARALIHASDKDGNQGIDFGEFAKFWSSLHGDSDALIREEFYKIDLDKSGYITKGSFLVFMFGKVLFLFILFISSIYL